MKKLIVLIAALVALSSTSAVLAQKQKKANNKETVEFFVTSEKICKNCVRKVKDNIPFERGVTGLEVNEEDNTIIITFRKDRTSVEKLAEAINKLKLEVAVVTDDTEFESVEEHKHDAEGHKH